MLEPGIKKDTEGNVQRLQALAWTCRRLRTVSQEVIWKHVRLESVRSVSRLRELANLSAPATAPGSSPSPLCFIESFEFGRQCNPEDLDEERLVLPRRHGSLEEVAFKNRSRMKRDKSDDSDDEDDEPVDFASGPDWRGKEAIGSAQQLKDTLSGLVKLTALNGRLESFCWACPIFPLPIDIAHLVASCASMKTYMFEGNTPTFRASALEMRELGSMCRV